MSKADVPVCQCPCHTNRTVTHAMPCCLICDICGEVVRFSDMASHTYAHEENAKWWEEQNADNT